MLVIADPVFISYTIEIKHMDFQVINTDELQSSKMKHIETCSARESPD